MFAQAERIQYDPTGSILMFNCRNNMLNDAKIRLHLYHSNCVLANFQLLPDGRSQGGLQAVSVPAETEKLYTLIAVYVTKAHFANV